MLLDAIAKGASDTRWSHETFAYADDFDQATGLYRGLRAGELPNVHLNPESLVIKPDVAARQLDAEAPKPTAAVPVTAGGPPVTSTGGAGAAPAAIPQPARLRRFHATVTLTPDRLSRDADQVAREVVTHLAGLVDSTVRVTLEIQADIPSGAPDQIVRTVTENCRTFKSTTRVSNRSSRLPAPLHYVSHSNEESLAFNTKLNPASFLRNIPVPRKLLNLST